ncbi:MAG TPA: carbon storage regulator [Candidatus Mediterraneibacter pullistercoris]|nr:carbon storage regulator [Candidatus Mediterraneibacter pullistercoris]
MLILGRKKGQEIVIGEDIVITVSEISADSVKLAVRAPRDVPVFRRELLQAAQENRDAASSDAAALDAAELAALIGENTAAQTSKDKKRTD